MFSERWEGGLRGSVNRWRDKKSEYGKHDTYPSILELALLDPILLLVLEAGLEPLLLAALDCMLCLLCPLALDFGLGLLDAALPDISSIFTGISSTGSALTFDLAVLEGLTVTVLSLSFSFTDFLISFKLAPSIMVFCSFS